MKSTRVCLILAAVASLTGAALADSVWVEGESAVKTNLSANGWLKGDNAKLLSGGDALACLNTAKDLPKPAFALWKVTVPKDGQYHVYFRHGYQGNTGKMRYRFIALGEDGKPVKKPEAEEGWIKFDLDAPVVDRKDVGQFRTIEWSRQEPVELKAGTYFLDLQVLAPNPGKEADGNNAPIWTVIDAICLTTEPFTPNGTLKPGEKAKEEDKKKGSEDYYN